MHTAAMGTTLRINVEIIKARLERKSLPHAGIGESSLLAAAADDDDDSHSTSTFLSFSFAS